MSRIRKGIGLQMHYIVCPFYLLLSLMDKMPSLLWSKFSFSTVQHLGGFRVEKHFLNPSPFPTGSHSRPHFQTLMVNTQKLFWIWIMILRLGMRFTLELTFCKSSMQNSNVTIVVACTCACWTRGVVIEPNLVCQQKSKFGSCRREGESWLNTSPVLFQVVEDYLSDFSQ